MSTILHKLLSTAAGVIVLAGGLVSTASPAGAASADRIAGPNRYATSAQIAQQYGAADAVIIANGENRKQGIDALAANYLAGRLAAPIVLTSASSVSSESLTAVKRILGAAPNPQIIVMGKADSVSPQVAKAIADAVSPNTTITRIDGADRFATAVLAATKAGDVLNSIDLGAGAGSLKTAFLVSGVVNADALVAGPISAAWGIPILLTSATMLPNETRSFIASHGIEQLIVLGGTDRVSQAALDSASSAGVTNVKRLAGPDRFATAASIYGFARASMVNSVTGRHYGSADGLTAYLANGTTGFPDALAVGPLAGKNEALLLTVPATTIPPAVVSILGDAAPSNLVALGQAASVSAAVLANAGRAAAGLPIEQPADPPSSEGTPAGAVTLSTGTHTVGVDIAAGRYTARAASGESGNFFVRGSDGFSVVNEILGGSFGVPSVTMTLVKGQTIEISSISTVTFTRTTPSLKMTLTTGTWTVGTDIAARRYVARPAPGESGNFFVRGSDGFSVVNEILGGSFGVPSVTMSLVKGQTIEIRGISSVTFTAK